MTKLGENYHRAEHNIRYTAFKVIRSNIETAITPPRIARVRLNLVQSFITSPGIYYKCSRLKVKVAVSYV